MFSRNDGIIISWYLKNEKTRKNYEQINENQITILQWKPEKTTVRKEWQIKKAKHLKNVQSPLKANDDFLSTFYLHLPTLAFVVMKIVLKTEKKEKPS